MDSGDGDSVVCCPFCGEEDCEHHLATFGIQESRMTGGEMYGLTGKVSNLITAALNARKLNELPYPFGCELSAILEEVDGEKQAVLNQIISNSLIASWLNTYCHELEDAHCDGEYEVEEATGLWSYVTFYAEKPKAIIDVLFADLNPS